MIRKIHLDFHTHPETAGIGRGFDPEAFADTLAEANVNYLATPGKCHFGNLYYASRIGRTHPHLEDPEMFPRTVAACQARGIEVQAYWTLGLDTWAAQQHPEWRQRGADGTYASWGHYLHMCFASPYIEEMVIPECLECLELCLGLAGFWFDIGLYVDGAFYSADFQRRAEAAGAETHDEKWQLGRQIIAERCRQIEAALQAVLPGGVNYYNSLVNTGEAANLPIQPMQEIENPLLFHGPERLNVDSRWLRRHRAPTVGLVSRFQGPWSDPGSLRTSDQLRFDVARTVAVGCQLSMGDHRYPDGSLEPEVYRRLAPIYGDIVKLEPWLDAAHPVREAILIGHIVSGQGHIAPDVTPTTKHAARLLETMGIQFDISLDCEEFPETDLVIWPGEAPGTPRFLDQLSAHIERGGAVLALHHALDGAEDLFHAQADDYEMTTTSGAAAATTIGHVAEAVAKAGACGPVEHFVRLRPDVGGEPFSQILKRPMRLLTAGPEATVLGDRHAPVSSKPPFPAHTPAGPAIVQHGRTIYSAADLFAEAAEEGSSSPAGIIAILCDRLLSKRLVRHDAGPTVVAYLHEHPDGHLLHLVHWALDRWGKQVNSATSFPRLGPIELQLRLDTPPQRITCQLSGLELDFSNLDGITTFTLPGLHIWQVISLQAPQTP